MYEHVYHYDSNRNLVGESLIGALGKIEFSGNREEGNLVFHMPSGEISPHWDYKGPDGRKARIYEDGTYEWKPK